MHWKTDAEAEAPPFWPPDVKSCLIRKEPDAGKRLRARGEGTRENEIIGWHHWHIGHEFEQSRAENEGQGSLACCNPWDRKADRTYWLRNNSKVVCEKLDLCIVISETITENRNNFSQKARSVQFGSVQSLSHVWLFETPWTAAHRSSISITNSQELAQIHAHQVSDAIQPSHSMLFLFLLPSIFPSIRVISKESVIYIRWSKHWSFSICSSNEYSGLISFRIDWLGLLAVQGTLKRLLQHHN